MPQGTLPFKYEAESTRTGMTSLGGLPTYLDLAHVAGLRKSVEKHLGVRRDSQGWTDAQVATALVMLNLAGGDHVDDLRILEADEGFCRIVRRVEHHGMPRTERRQLDRRWRKQKERTLPSPSAVFRYLSAFHDPDQEERRTPGKAFIPAPNTHLAGMAKVNGDLLAFLQANR
ncbi:MAG: IS1380 family transposase, partial [Desulfobulbales bacterium]|nr:IS1380 family transposase [Desulfobulbales bacterium]